MMMRKQTKLQAQKKQGSLGVQESPQKENSRLLLARNKGYRMEAYQRHDGCMSFSICGP